MNKLAPLFLAVALSVPGIALAERGAPGTRAEHGEHRHERAEGGARGERRALGRRASGEAGTEARADRIRDARRLGVRLELTPAQQRHLQQVIAEARRERRALRQLPAADRPIARRELHVRTRAAIDAVLTPRQRAMRDAARHARHAQHEGRTPHPRDAR